MPLASADISLKNHFDHIWDTQCRFKGRKRILLQDIDDFGELTGETSVDYVDKTMCCGMPTLTSDMKVGLGISRSKLDNVRKVNADAMVTSCPICHMMFDSNQPWIEKTFDEKYGIPVLHLSQLLGLAMGFDYKELGLDRNTVDTISIIKLMKS
jgi:heterodisulfide reductase subunit B